MDALWGRVVLPLVFATLSIAVAVVALIYGMCLLLHYYNHLIKHILHCKI